MGKFEVTTLLAHLLLSYVCHSGSKIRFASVVFKRSHVQNHVPLDLLANILKFENFENVYRFHESSRRLLAEEMLFVYQLSR